MHRAHKIRLNPTPEQQAYFRKAAGTARFVYNWGLSEVKRALDDGRTPDSTLDLKARFNAIKREQFPWVYAVTKCVVEGAFQNLGAALANFRSSKRGARKGKRMGFPRFKRRKRGPSSFYLANDKFAVDGHWISIPKLGQVNMTEPLRLAGKIMGATISERAGWWWVSIQVDVSREQPIHQGHALGVDVGVKDLAVDSDGERFENQKPLRTAMGRVKRLQRRVSRCVKQQQRPGDWIELRADDGATYDEYELIELDRLEPLIAKPSSPGNVVPVREVAGTPVAQVCVGSSVNSGYADLAIVAAVLRDQTISDNLVMTVTPGSRQILDTIAQTGVYRDLVGAGARMLEPACGPCVGMGQAPPSGSVSVRTFNRNFPGRSGTQNDQVYLCSPATAAASALRGVITDPRDLGPAEPSFAPPAFNPAIDDRQILAPAPAEQAAAIVIPRGPNIQPPPPQTPLPEMLAGQVLIVVGDDISTGDLSPDGAEVMAFRSNVRVMANFVFRRIDPEFAARARGWHGGFIVGGHNYGQR